MRILFVHQNYPAQFGELASYLARHYGDECYFLARNINSVPVNCSIVRYQLRGGARTSTHPWSRMFENAVWHSDAAALALRSSRVPTPDVVVAHSGFLIASVLRDVLGAPIVNYFEYYYDVNGGAAVLRPDLFKTQDRSRSRIRNACMLVDLVECQLGYCPTRWQRGLFPEPFRSKLGVAFDGVDTIKWSPSADTGLGVPGLDVPVDRPMISFVARGLESVRGFDIFVKIAGEICRIRKDVLCVVVGRPVSYYADDTKITGGESFKDWVLANNSIDSDRVVFIDWMDYRSLAKLFTRSAVHFYLSAPFVLSWSFYNALSCGAMVVASRIPAVEEVLGHEDAAIMHDLADIDGMVGSAVRFIDNPSEAAPWRVRARSLIESSYGLPLSASRIRSLLSTAIEGSAMVPASLT